MRVKKFHNFFQITFLSAIFPINCYVYEESSSLTVIDIGVKSFVKHIKKLSDSLNKPVTHLIITHPHQDHVGGLDEFKQNFDNAQIYISHRDSLLFEGDFSLFENEDQSTINSSPIKNIKTKPDFLVNEGDYIGSLKVISTIGHTPGSISLYDKKSMVIFVGDLIQVKGGLAVAGDTRWLFPFPAMATWSKTESINSVKKILKLEIQYLATGHGNVLYNPTQDINKAVIRAEKRVKHEKKKEERNFRRSH